MLLTCAAYFAYEFLTFRQAMIQQLTILSETIATNSTAALAFENKDDATEILSALKADKHIVAASLYDNQGNLFATYPQNSKSGILLLPGSPSDETFHFENSHLAGFHPVMQGGKRLGTLYLRSDLGAMYERFQLYAGIAVLVIGLSFFISYLLSKRLQQRISKPILVLTETARVISSQGDYSVRAIKLGEDELGVLTDAINQMLNRIEEQTAEITSLNQGLEQKVFERTNQLNKTTELFSKLFNYNPAAISITRLSDATYLELNDAFVQMTGFSKEELLGHSSAELGLVVNVEKREDVLKQIRENGSARNFEMTIRQKSGGTLETLTSVETILLDDEKYAINIIHDITERKRAEEQLSAVNKELEAFSYSVSHDLRAPLRSIHSYINILFEEYGERLDDEAKRLINIVMSNSKKMGQLIDDLLAFSRLGRRELTRTVLNMQSLVKSVWEDQVVIQGRKNLKLVMGEYLPNATGDSAAITQVWTNLISNALKYSRNKECSIVEIGHLDKDGTTVYYVRDNGAGFDMKYYDKLFGVFQRLHSSKEFEGTGVGLAIVHRIVSKHGGTVWADSKVNEGTTFFFSLSGKT